MRAPAILVVAGLLAIAPAACGDGDDEVESAGGNGGLSAQDEQYIDDAVATFDPEADAPLTEDDARCIVTSMVRGVGAKRLDDIGIKAEDFANDEQDFPAGLTEAEANKIVDRIERCLDLPTMFVETFAEDGDLDEETRECLTEQFDPDFLRRLFVAMFRGDEEALADDSPLTDELFVILTECPGVLDAGS